MILTKEEIIFCYDIITRMTYKYYGLEKFRIEREDLVNLSILHMLTRTEYNSETSYKLPREDVLKLCCKYAITNIIGQEKKRKANNHKWVNYSDHVAACEARGGVQSYDQCLVELGIADTLTENELHILRLKCEYRYSLEQISDLLAWPLPTVRYLLKTLRKKMRIKYDIR